MIDCFRRSRFTPTDRLSIAMTTLTTASKPHHDVIPELNRNNTAKKTTGSVGDCKPTGRVFKKKKKGCVWGMRWNPPGRHIQPLGGFFFFFFMCPQGILPGTQGENLSLSSPLHTNQVAPLFSFEDEPQRRKKKTFSFFFDIKKSSGQEASVGPFNKTLCNKSNPPSSYNPNITDYRLQLFGGQENENNGRENVRDQIGGSILLLFWFFSKRENGAQAKFSPRDDAHKTLSKDGRHFCVVFLFLAGTRKKTCHKMEDVNQ